MSDEQAGRVPLAGSVVRLAATAGAGVAAAVVVYLVSASPLAVMVGWDVLAATYVAWVWLGARGLDSAATLRLAVRDDPGRVATDVLLLAASVASLVGVGLVVLAGRSSHGTARDLTAVLAVLSVAVSWALVHTVYTERYARLYHADPAGGIDFNESGPPCFTDFAYLAFTIGMTFQVSDTDLTTRPVRATVLRHALLSYLFGAVIIAATINLLVGLST